MGTVTLTSHQMRRHRLRQYHFAATMLVLGMVSLVFFAVLSVQETASENLQKTNCNQGLLLLATTGHFDQTRIAQCSPEIRKAVQGLR